MISKEIGTVISVVVACGTVCFEINQDTLKSGMNIVAGEGLGHRQKNQETDETDLLVAFLLNDIPYLSRWRPVAAMVVRLLPCRCRQRQRRVFMIGRCFRCAAFRSGRRTPSLVPAVNFMCRMFSFTASGFHAYVFFSVASSLP